MTPSAAIQPQWPRSRLDVSPRQPPIGALYKSPSEHIVRFVPSPPCPCTHPATVWRQAQVAAESLGRRQGMSIVLLASVGELLTSARSASTEMSCAALGPLEHHRKGQAPQRRLRQGSSAPIELPSSAGFPMDWPQVSKVKRLKRRLRHGKEPAKDVGVVR